MCGLYSNRKMAAEVNALFKADAPANFVGRDYVSPGGPMEIVLHDGTRRQFAIVRWSFVPSWSKEMRKGRPLINARAETIAEKPSFRSAIRRRRCLIPADAYYEWTGDVPGKKQPWRISRPGDVLFAMAGIYEYWMGPDGSELQSAAIITTAANVDVAEIHHRMPAIIGETDFSRWLDPQIQSPGEVADLLVPAPEGLFGIEKTTINRPAKKTPVQPKPDQLNLF